MLESHRRVIAPKFVALDSSHLGAIAADAAAKDRACQQRATAFARTLEVSDSVLLLCRHHIQELFSHQNEGVVAHRVAYLQSLPVIGYVSSFRQDDVIGSVLDLQSFEVAAAFKNPNADVVTVRDEVAKIVFRLASGAEIVRPFLLDWSTYRADFLWQEMRRREIISISRSKFVDQSDQKIMDLLKFGRPRVPQDIQTEFRHMHNKLTDDLVQCGDKRILDPERSSQAFLDEVRYLGMQAIQGDDPVLQILKASGVGLDEIGPETTVADVGNMATYRRKLEILNQNLNLPWKDLILRVKEERLPSGVIMQAIARYHPDTREWDGSELTDRYLACLSAYADVTHVDKRTHEASRQARQKSKAFDLVARRIEKAATYDEIAQRLLTP